MWTPRPVRPLRYAGSVATSVLPSPVAISAILPSWRTMPPISWTSKGRMPTVRRAASRATANASGSSASTDSPASRRFLNSSVFARSSASPSAWTDGSSAFVASTVGIMRLTSRSCLVPKIFRRIASIITIDYGISPASRPPFARSGCAEQLARVAARGVGDPLAREHARDLLDAGVAGEPLEGDARAPRADGLGHAHVVAGARGDRREVGHTEHLTALRDRRELLCDDRGDTSTDARVHLVEDHRRHAVRLCQHGRQPEHRARELAARRHARERPHVLARIGREPELDPLEPPGRHPLELRPFQPDPEVGALHAERAQLPLHGGPQTLRRGPPPLRERRGRLPELGLELAEPPLLGREDLLVAREPVELGDDLVAELEHRLLGIAVFPLEAGERVEPLVDHLQAAGLERHRLAERSDRREGVFELRPSRVDRLDGGRHRGARSRPAARVRPASARASRNFATRPATRSRSSSASAKRSRSSSWRAGSSRRWCSCWPCTSTRWSPRRSRSATVTAASLTKARWRPERLSSRRATSTPSSGASPASSSVAATAPRGSTSKTASTVAASASLRITSVWARAPRTNKIASMSIDFPAPVSPVRTLSPGRNSTATLSMTAKFRMRSSRSIENDARSLAAAAQVVSGGRRPSAPPPLQLGPEDREELLLRETHEANPRGGLHHLHGVVLPEAYPDLDAPRASH